MSDLRDHSQPCRHEVTDRYEGAYEWAGNWHCGDPSCPGGREVTDEDILALAAALEPFQCGGCDEWTSVSHWRSGADGAMFHAGSDAPPSDPSPVDNTFGDTE